MMNGASKVADGGTYCFVQSDLKASNKNSSRNQATYAEYDSYGPGATASKLKQRVGWSRQLNEVDASEFTAETTLRGWRPQLV